MVGSSNGNPERHDGQRRLAAIARAASSVADTGSLGVSLDVVAREVVQAEHIAAVQILRVEGGAMRLVGKAGLTEADDFPEPLEECRRLGARMMFVEAVRTASRIVVPHRKAAQSPSTVPHRKLLGQIIVRHMCAEGDPSNPRPSLGWRKLRPTTSSNSSKSTTASGSNE
jgi:hypothetical protein